MATPPIIPTVQVAAAKVTTALLGMDLASPQNVIGPPAAAANSRVAAGAVPMPSSKRSATRGISNSRVTLISRPKVAAIATPITLFPRYCSTTSGLVHCMTRPLANPARTIMGPSRTTKRMVALPQSVKASRIVGPQRADSAISEDQSGPCSGKALFRLLVRTMTTNGPMRRAAATPMTKRPHAKQRREDHGHHYQ